MAERENHTTVGAMMLIAGGVIGAGLALLYAPQQGKKTRKQIVRYGRRVRNDTERKMRDAAEAAIEMADDLGDKTRDLVESGADAAEDWRRHLLDAMEKGQKNLERQRQRLLKHWG